ncbi:zinc-binding dehydrogenase [Pseudoduganella sp. FT26W]|uniref:Zinc-binding dehydrogenase n=1 Tax=Duganella aquatilis TaxID=2666082 RepID=A0A844DFP6_9BURK|nr:quinone oxidoreductase [Duganella aquatilis]MRW87390.1 zinc-binding dehydrogenase [Duganella aquatilis]
MTHHRVRIYEQGPPSVMWHEEVLNPLPAPANGQVLIKQEAIGVNFVDTMFRDGTFNVPLPFDMGVEAAGVVTAIGPDVKDFRVGDRVAYFFAPGAYTDARLISTSALVMLPDSVPARQAAAILSKGLTAWMAVRRAHVVKAGQLVYVSGASGAVGSLIAKWAVALGATVIAAVGSEQKALQARDAGLSNVVVTSAPDFAEQVDKIVAGRAIDVVYELVGRATFEQSAALLGAGGSLIHIGNASGAASVDLAKLAARSIRYLQPSTPQYVKLQHGVGEATEELFEALRSGVFGDIAISEYALEDAVRAHNDIAQRRIQGFPILIPAFDAV